MQWRPRLVARPARAGYNAQVAVLLSPQEAVNRLLAAAWEPQGLPAPEAIPWPEVLRLVGPSNVGGAVYAATQGMREAMPADVREALEQAYYRSAAENTRCLHQLARVGQALSRTGARLLLLKGAALAETLYDDPALRLIGDIDLAVPRPDVPACRDVLMDLGYAPGQVETQPGDLLAHSNQELFTPPDPYRTPLELHWHILDVPYYLNRVPMDWFWGNSETRTIAGQPFQLLNPEANLIYLPAHLALHHRFHSLHSHLDLALLIQRYHDRLDWDKVVGAARSFELVTVLRETLARLAERWPSLPLDAPRRQMQRVRPSRTDERLFRLITREERNPNLYVYTTLVSMPDFAARARFAWANLFPQPAYMKTRYSVGASWQLPYWYVYRLARGLSRYARSLPRLRRFDREGR
jgi:hypothetical protein